MNLELGITHNFKNNPMNKLKTIEFRFLLTPIATTIFTAKGVKRKRYYIFGFKIIDLVRD